MSNKSISKKEEFFQVLNLIATKKVKVRYCRTIKERLRPSTIEESLALPIKPKSPPKRKVEANGSQFLTPENQTENLQLRGGVSLLKSYKNKKKIKMKTASPSTQPCTKSLLSYLQHKAKDSDSSSVESDCESSTDVESVRDEYKLTQISISMPRLSPEKLERISSRTCSLDELKMKGFSDEIVHSSKKNKKNLIDLINNLETEIDDHDDKKERDSYLSMVLNKSFEEKSSDNDLESLNCKVTSQDLSNDNLEVVEDRDVVMQMVEDFSLLSESDSEDEYPIDCDKVLIKTEPEELIDDPKTMVWFPEGQDQYQVKKENIDTKKSNSLSRSCELVKEGCESRYEEKSSDSDSTEETLDEMLYRLESSKSSLVRNGYQQKVAFSSKVDGCESESFESCYFECESPEFDNPVLATLVSRMRRELRIEKKKKSKFLLEGSGKCSILEKCEYWKKREKYSLKKPYDCIILHEPKSVFSRLSRPSREDVLRARKFLKIDVLHIQYDDREEIGDDYVEQLLIDKPIELVKKKKVKKKRPLEGGKRRRKVNGIDEYIRNMMDNREKVVETPDSEPASGLSCSDLVSNIIYNDVDVSSEIYSTSLSRDTLDISLHAETEAAELNLEQEDDDMFVQEDETFRINYGSHTKPVENNTNPWDEGVCILEKVESPRKHSVKFEDEDFSSVDSLEPDHLESKEDEDYENGFGFGSKKYQCNKCGKEFGTKNGLDYHERTHSGLSPFECDVCFKRFKSSSLCSRHKQIHSITKKYNCDVCLKSFAQKSNLSKHMDIHAGIKPYQCPTCPKAFTQKVHLECHIMTHTKDKPWKCLACATRFSKKSSLIRHSQNVHDMGKDDHEKFILLEEASYEKEVPEEEDDDEKKLLARVKQMRKERRRKEKFEVAFKDSEISNLDYQQLNVIPIAVGDDQASIEVANTVLDNLVQNDLNDVNEQFDVEVTYCEDIDILNVPNDTLFIMDNTFDEKETENDTETPESSAIKAKSADMEQDSEQIEDIQKFLEESKSGTSETDLASPEYNPVKKAETKHNLGAVDESVISKKISLHVPELSGDKKPKYRIPKSPRKQLKQDRRTPHIPYNKESGLKIISLSENFSRSKVKNDFKSPKKHSFEQALNEALTFPSKKVDRFLDRKTLSQQKPSKLSIISRRISQSNELAPKVKQEALSSPEKLSNSLAAVSKLNIPYEPEFSSPKPNVMKRILGQHPLTMQNNIDKKPVIKPLFKPVVKPNCQDPKRIKLENNVSKLEIPPPKFSTSQLKLLSQSLKTVQPEVSVPSSQDLYNSLKADLFNNSSGLDLYSSAAVRGLPVPVPAASELQSTLTTISAYLTTSNSSSLSHQLAASASNSLVHPTQAVVEPIKRSESQGYYTSNRAKGLPDVSKANWVKLDTGRGPPELTDIESTDVESEEDNPVSSKDQLPTFLPTNFPTFDSPCSSPRSLSGLSSASAINYGSSLSGFSSGYNPQPMGVSNIKHSGIKPTAVVSPSRPRMPVLPKPVPAAFASSPVRVEKVSVVTTFMCSVCGAEFNSRASLVTHEQSTHWRS